MDTIVVSILLPIINESATIQKCLEAILIQDYFRENMEIVIADGMSDDGTRSIVSGIIARTSDTKIRMVDNVNRITPTGLNVAIRHAIGEILIRVDGHTIISPDYVRNCIEVLQKGSADNVGGKMNAIGVTAFGRAVAFATSSPFGVGGARFHYSDQEEWVDTVYMGAWPRRVFEKIGLFDEELIRNQDDEFNYRLRAAGGKILLSPKIKSEYTVRGSPGKLWRQYFQYGFWKVRVLQKHPRQMSLRQFVPPVFVLSLLGSILLALLSIIHYPISILDLLSSVIPLFYLLANLGASLWTASKRGWRYFPLLPIIFAILHLSYGFGFLVGLFKFWNRWGDKTGKVPVWSNEAGG